MFLYILVLFKDSFMYWESFGYSLGYRFNINKEKGIGRIFKIII